MASSSLHIMGFWACRFHIFPMLKDPLLYRPSCRMAHCAQNESDRYGNTLTREKGNPRTVSSHFVADAWYASLMVQNVKASLLSAHHHVEMAGPLTVNPVIHNHGSSRVPLQPELI